MEETELINKPFYIQYKPNWFERLLGKKEKTTKYIFDGSVYALTHELRVIREDGNVMPPFSKEVKIIHNIHRQKKLFQSSNQRTMTKKLTDHELIEKCEEALILYENGLAKERFTELLTHFKQRTAANPLTVESVKPSADDVMDTFRSNLIYLDNNWSYKIKWPELRTALNKLFNK